MKPPPRLLYCLLSYRAQSFQIPQLFLKAMLEVLHELYWMFAEDLPQLKVSKLKDSIMLCSVIYLPVSSKVASGKL